MVKQMWIIISVVILTVCVMTVYFVTRQKANPNATSFRSIVVTEEMITLNTIQYASSVGWYAGENISYADGVLSVAVYVHSPIRFPGDTYLDATTIRIPNTYPDLREIRLVGAKGTNERVVWQATAE